MYDENTIKLLDESPAEELSDSLPHKQTCNSILNIINNNKKLSRKVILLSGVRGSGKTTIIQKLIRENEKDKVFITIDAWNAPEDVLKKEFLRCLYRGIDNNSDEELKKKIDHNIKAINTIKKETIANISRFTILIYSFIFILIPILIPVFTSINSQTIYYIILLFIFILILIFIFILFKYKNHITKILFPFLYGSSDNYSEYEEGKDLTPYQFEKFIKDFYKLYSDFFDKKDIVIAIDNIDRLSKDEEEKFISSLYTFIECMQKKYDSKKNDNINTWFIFAVDKKSIGKNDSSVDNSFYDKLSPYEVSIPEMNDNIVNNFFFNEINYKNIFDKDMLNNLRNCDIRSLLDLIKNFEIETKKDEYVLFMEYYYTPRLIKKFINQIEINYKENLVNVDSNKNKETMFLASTIVSAIQIFNREDIKDNIINLIDDLPPTFNYTEKYQKQFGVFLKNEDNNEKYAKYKEIINKYIESFSKENIYIDRKLLKEYIKIIFYKQKIPNKEAFSNLISKYYKREENIENIITEIDNYFSIFSSDILLKNLQEGVLEIIDDKNIYYIINISKELNESLKKHEINFLEKSQNLSDKILEYNYNIDKTNNNIFYIYVYFINKDKYKNEIKNILNNILNSKRKYKANVLLDFIELINDFYKNNKNINIYNISYYILNDYDFLIDAINNNYLYILFGNYYTGNSYGMILESYGSSYYYINRLKFVAKKVIFDILNDNNINNAIKVLLKGINKSPVSEMNDDTDIGNVFIRNEDIWILIFNDLYAAKKIDKDNSYKLINMGLEFISKQKQYILYFIAFDYFYRYREFPIDDEKIKTLKVKNYVYIIIIAIYKYKGNPKYDNLNKKIIKNIIRNYNDYRLFDLNIEDIIDVVLNFIYIEVKDENDEYYQYFKKLKDDFENNINNSQYQ